MGTVPHPVLPAPPAADGLLQPVSDQHPLGQAQHSRLNQFNLDWPSDTLATAKCCHCCCQTLHSHSVLKHMTNGTQDSKMP